MDVVFHSNFAAYIACRRYKPCEFLGLVWTDCWGNKSDYDITSPANRLYVPAKFRLCKYSEDYPAMLAPPGIVPGGLAWPMAYAKGEGHSGEIGPSGELEGPLEEKKFLKSTNEKNQLLLMMQKRQDLPPQNGIAWPFKVLKPCSFWGYCPLDSTHGGGGLCDKLLAVLATPAPYTTNQTLFRGVAKSACPFQCAVHATVCDRQKYKLHMISHAEIMQLQWAISVPKKRGHGSCFSWK